MSEPWTIRTLLDDLACRGEAPAVITLESGIMQTLSCAALADRARRLACGLAGLGVAPGEPVAVIAPNGPDWIAGRLALGAAGALAVALDDLATEEELRVALVDSGCRRVLTSPTHVGTLRTIDPRLDLAVIGSNAPIEGTRSWEALLAAPVRPLPSLAPDAPAMLVYTSGTTGPPKGFVLSYANLWANLRTLAAARLVGPGDRVLLPLPLHHVYPFVAGLLTPLSSGATVVFPEAVAGPPIMRAVRLAEVSAIVGVPRLYKAILSGLEASLAAHGFLGRALLHGLLGLSAWLRCRHGVALGRWLFRPLRARIGPALRLLVSGGARLEPEVLRPLIGLGFEVRSGYGLAETASIFTGNLPECERLGSEGKPFPGGRLRIAEPDAEGVGEIELSGPNVFAGYRNNPEADREAFTVDGWFRTGDLGYLDGDGFLYVTGRRKEAIVLGGGKKVHPEELEKLYGACPYIREIAILERQGALVALVLPDLEAARAGPSVRIDDAIRVALATRAQELPSYQRLAGFALAREPLPRTRLGKYQRFRLPELYDRMLAGPRKPTPRALAPGDEALLAQPTARRIYALIEARYPDKAVALDANPLLDLGIDSLEWVALGLALEEGLGIRLTATDIARTVTLRDLLRQMVASESSTEQAAKPVAAAGLAAADARWLSPVGPGAELVALFIYGINRVVMRRLFRLRVEGNANLPAVGPYLLVCNHASDLDPALLAAAFNFKTARRLYWGGEARRLFSRRWLHPLMRALHVFPVDEGAPAQALALGKAVLMRGDSLVWFPESWRSPDGRLQRFLTGIGWLLEQARVPAVPVYIAGSYEAMPRNRPLPRLHPVRVLIGRPLEWRAFAAAAADGEEMPRRITTIVRAAVAALEREASDAKT
jgi:long-chain acyl-CoA synthetase